MLQLVLFYRPVDEGHDGHVEPPARPVGELDDDGVVVDVGARDCGCMCVVGVINIMRAHVFFFPRQMPVLPSCAYRS